MPGLIDDPTLGRLAWDKEFNWWTGEVELEPGQKVGLTVEADPKAPEPEAVLARARVWLDRIREREDEYARWTAEHLLGTRWNKEQPMTLDDVFGLLEPAAVECFPDGTASLTWDDDDVLFFGHGIQTHLDAKGNCVRIEVQ
jgi:hypothetical protein